MAKQWRQEAALPPELTVGKNAEQGIDVYTGVRDRENVYAGITNNVARRADQHGGRFDNLRLLTDGSLTRGEARAIEQALIDRNPDYENRINSISHKKPWYRDAVNWGEMWLRRSGY